MIFLAYNLDNEYSRTLACKYLDLNGIRRFTVEPAITGGFVVFGEAGIDGGFVETEPTTRAEARRLARKANERLVALGRLPRRTETVAPAEAEAFLGGTVGPLVLSVVRDDKAYGRPIRVDLYGEQNGLVVYSCEAGPTLTRAIRRAKRFARRRGYTLA
jgi:hypothetical protein